MIIYNKTTSRKTSFKESDVATFVILATSNVHDEMR